MNNTLPPFTQPPYSQVPELPRVPHDWLSLETHYATTSSRHFGDFKTAYRVFGEGPPLLLVHGLMTTSYSWRYVYTQLGRRYRVYMLDLVGTGDSDKPDRVYAPDAVADTLAAFMEAVGIVGCDVIGNSMGGYLAMRTALRHPSSVHRLVNLHSPGLPTLRLLLLWTAIRIPGAEQLLRLLVRRDPELWTYRNVHYYDETLKSRQETRLYAQPLLDSDGLRGFARHLRDVLDVREMRRFEHTLRRRRDQHRPFPVPLLLLYARTDPMVPPAIGDRLADYLPEAVYDRIERGSHFAHVDAPEAFLEAVERFLTT